VRRFKHPPVSDSLVAAVPLRPRDRRRPDKVVTVQLSPARIRAYLKANCDRIEARMSGR
jgi:hypothetical protein